MVVVTVFGEVVVVSEDIALSRQSRSIYCPPRPDYLIRLGLLLPITIFAEKLQQKQLAQVRPHKKNYRIIWEVGGGVFPIPKTFVIIEIALKLTYSQGVSNDTLIQKRCVTHAGR